MAKKYVLGCGVGAELDGLRAADDGRFGCKGPGGDHGDHHDQREQQRKDALGTMGVLHIITSFLPCGKDIVPEDSWARRNALGQSIP